MLDLQSVPMQLLYAVWSPVGLGKENHNLVLTAPV